MAEKVKAKITLNRNQKKMIFYVLMMAYPVIQFCIFYIGVNLNSILLAFKEYEYGLTQDSITGYHWAGFSQFEKIFNMFSMEEVFKYAFINSFVAYVITTVASISLTIFFAYYVFKKKLFSRFFKVMLFLPSVISSLVMAVLFTSLAESIIPGILNELFGVEVNALLTDPNSRFGMIIFYSIWVSFGTNILLYNGSMTAIDVEIIEAAHMDGAEGFKEFIYIIFPLIFPTFTTLFVTGLAGVFTNQYNLHAIYGEMAPRNIYTVGYYLFVRVKVGTYADYTYLSAFGLLLTAVIMPVVLVVRWLMVKFGPTAN